MPWAPERIAVEFWKRVTPDDGCWLWQGVLNDRGYGNMYLGYYKMGSAHRVSYEINVGPIPAGLQLDHLCRNPPCVNPAHLEPVTPRENIRRSTAPSALNMVKTHCVAGHPLSGPNLRVNAAGHRICHQCKLDRQNIARIVTDGPGVGGFQRAITHCPVGHPYDEQNTYRSTNKKTGIVRRHCRTCMVARNRARKAARRVQVLEQAGV